MDSNDEHLQLSNNQTGKINAAIFLVLIIIIIILSFIAFNRKPKTIYLKPKKTEKVKKKKEEPKEEPKEKPKEEPKEEEKNIKEVSAPQIKPDEDAIRSELKSLRQTAVSLTVGEKEGASTLIKEWLEDNPNKEENTDENEGDE